jgi:oligopeptide/dipeptide ABC transporter ATP-binding protein
MYAGHVVEDADVETIFRAPRHPYTMGLMNSLPRLERDEERLQPIKGQPPSLINVPPGCPFHPRCYLREGRQVCVEELPPLEAIDNPDHLSACHFKHEMKGDTSKFADDGVAS